MPKRSPTCSKPMGRGKCIEPGRSARQTRSIVQWLADVEAARGAWETVVQIPTEWNPEKFLSGTANALEAHPKRTACLLRFRRRDRSKRGKLHPPARKATSGSPLRTSTRRVTAMMNGYIDVATTYDAYFHAVERPHSGSAGGR